MTGRTYLPPEYKKVGERKWQFVERISAFLITVLLRRNYTGPTIYIDRKNKCFYKVIAERIKE